MGDIEAAVPRDTLALLYERTVGPSEALARGLCGDAHLAEDVAQEAFIRAAARLPFLRDPSAFDAYVRRTVVNLCRAHARHAAVERKGNERVSQLVPQSPAPVSEQHDAMWAAVQQLPYRQRAAIVLRYYEDLSEAQTAQVLRCSERAVNSLVSRAMSTLRQIVEEER